MCLAPQERTEPEEQPGSDYQYDHDFEEAELKHGATPSLFIEPTECSAADVA